MQVALHKSAADWAHLAYKSIETGYPLQDVHVITNRSEYIDLVHTAAAELLIDAGIPPTRYAITKAAELTADDVEIYTTERVVVDSERIAVFVNVESIDDSTVVKVCEMVEDALDQLNGSHGEVFFSEPMQFDITEELIACH